MEHTKSLQDPIQFPIKLLDPSTREIHLRAKVRAKRYLLAEGELLSAIMEVDEKRIYEKFHLTHLTPYCVQLLGLSEDVAASFVRVARKCRQVPQLQAAIGEVRIPMSKARAIASVITKENHAEWIGKASRLSKAELEREVAEVSPHAAKPEKIRPISGNRVRVEFELSQEDAELLRRAQVLLGQKRQGPVSLGETVKELTEDFLDRKDPVRKATRRLSEPEALPTSLRRAASPGSLTSGRRSRDRSARPTIPAKILHVVNARDRGQCQARLPGGKTCGATQWVHLHHRRPLNLGGTHTAENLITLCAAHHRQWHRREDPSAVDK